MGVKSLDLLFIALWKKSAIHKIKKNLNIHFVFSPLYSTALKMSVPVVESKRSASKVTSTTSTTTSTKTITVSKKKLQEVVSDKFMYFC